MEDFVSSHVVETLHTASAVHEVGYFDALVKVSSGQPDALRIPQTKEGFNAEFLRKHIREENGKWPLVLLCATPAMIASVTTDLVTKISLPAGHLIYV